LPANTIAAIGAVTTRGTVAAAHGGTFGTHSLAAVGGANALSPKNLTPIVDSDSHDPILSSGRVVWALFQTESVSDGSTITGDIAHHRETVVQAVEKFELTLNRVWKQTHAQTLRLIVGGGLIRDAVLAELYFKKSRGTVLDFSEENRGALIIRIR
jgi:hypothetical protein